MALRSKRYTEGQRSRSPIRRAVLSAFLAGALLSGFACGGGNNAFTLTVVNTLQSSEPLTIDLGGETRSLNIGDITEFRSVSRGRHIFSIEGLTCSGVLRDTLMVEDDLTIRYAVSAHPTTGACQLESNVAPTRPVSPVSRRVDHIPVF